MSTTPNFDHLREECLHQLQQLRADADIAWRHLENFHLPASVQASASMLVQLQRSVQTAYSYGRACRQCAQFLHKHGEHLSHP